MITQNVYRKRISRSIPEHTQKNLLINSAGRCQFHGCNRFLFEHSITLQTGNFANYAHIIAFSKDGPRGYQEVDPELLNDFNNLMLLCPECHKLIDDRPEEYTVNHLRQFKQNHEDRVRYLTGLDADSKTVVVRCAMNINDKVICVPFEDIAKVVFPRWPDSRDCIDIDMTSTLGQSSKEYYQTKAAEIKMHIERVISPSIQKRPLNHVSVFAVGPIPLLTQLGYCLGDAIPADIYQRHRDTDQWEWKKEGAAPKYGINTLQFGKKELVALMLNLSGVNTIETLPTEIKKKATIYEITLINMTPNPLFLNVKEGIGNFLAKYREFMSMLRTTHDGLKDLHIFPAVPAPIAIVCGRSLLPKIDPSLLLYDLDKKNNQFVFSLGVN